MTSNPILNATCECGQLSISASSSPVAQLVCHCSDCRGISGQPYTEVAFFAPSACQIDGEAGASRMKGGSGHDKSYFTCIECGTPLYATVDALDGAVGIVAGYLSPFTFKPWLHIWTSEMAEGTKIPTLSIRLPKGPPKLTAVLLRSYMKLFS